MTKLVLELTDEVEKALDFSEIFLRIWSVIQIIISVITSIFIFTLPFTIPFILIFINLFKVSDTLNELKYNRDETVVKDYFKSMAKAVKMVYIYVAITLIIAIGLFIPIVTKAILNR